jgi:crossover junction endodeoxyribonuclease RusA
MTYDDKKSKDWKETVALEAKKNHCKPMEGPLRMVLTFRLKKPKSAPKSRIWPVVRPDLDNFTKAIKDGLNEICYKDDSQIVVLEAKKEYAKEGFSPGVLVMIEKIG